jgi:hypothetical protein
MQNEENVFGKRRNWNDRTIESDDYFLILKGVC